MFTIDHKCQNHTQSLFESGVFVYIHITKLGFKLSGHFCEANSYSVLFYF